MYYVKASIQYKVHTDYIVYMPYKGHYILTI